MSNKINTNKEVLNMDNLFKALLKGFINYYLSSFFVFVL